MKERDIIALRDFTIREKRYVASEDKKPDSYYRKVETAKTATLTDYGMEVMYQFYVESLHGDDPAPRAYFEKLREPFLADITQLSDDAYREVLNQYDVNRIKTIFNIAGVQTEPASKPCLEQIYRYRNNLEYEGEYSEGYKLYQDDDRLDKRLDEGIYYTASEYREFYDNFFVETKENVLSDIGISLGDEKDTFVPIVTGGNQWYNTAGTLNVIMDDTDKVTIVYKNRKFDDEKREVVRIHGLPKRPNKTTKLSLEVEFESPNEGAVIIRDMGFGKMFPTTNKIYRKEFKI